MEAGKWIFELSRINSMENEPSILACPPYFKLTLFFKLKNKFIFNIQLSTAALREKKRALRLTFAS